MTASALQQTFIPHGHISIHELLLTASSGLSNTLNIVFSSYLVAYIPLQDDQSTHCYAY